MEIKTRGVAIFAILLAATVTSGTMAYQNHTTAKVLRMQIEDLEKNLDAQRREFDAQLADFNARIFKKSRAASELTGNSSSREQLPPPRRSASELTGAVIDQALDTFQSLDPHRRADALWELARLARLADDPRARETLLAAVNDSDAALRREAVTGIGLLQDPALLTSLDPMADDPDPGVRRAVLDAVLRISRTPELSGPIVAKFLGDVDENVATQALRSIARLDYRPALAQVRELTFSENLEVAASAAFTARSLGDDGIADNAIPYVARGLDSADSRERSKALERLGDIGGRAAIPYLESALLDPDPEVRADAQYYLDDVTQQIQSQG